MVKRDRLNLPPRIFLYTLDQVSFLLEIDESFLKKNFLFYEGRSVGICPGHLLRAVDISPPDSKETEWRVTEDSLLRWMRYMGFKYLDRNHLY